MGAHFPTVLVLLLAVTACQGQPSEFQTIAPPPDSSQAHVYKEEAEKARMYGNMTMDQIITDMLGGVNVASQMFLGDGSNILAELDMYLTEKQFNSMYHPPTPQQMEKMGIMPAPLGTSSDYHPGPQFSDPENDFLNYRQRRKATNDETKRWTQATVPYLFAKGDFDSKEEYMMRRAMTEWERYTCIKFRPATNADANSLYFQNGAGCNSQLGMVGGRQLLNLQKPGCRFKGLYLHEIGHALGLVHEHQLPNRDNYIDILYYNVSPHMRIWFNKYNKQQVNQMDVHYQLSSVMHYGITAFSKDGKSQTIRAKDRALEETIGRVYLKELAYTDVEIVNKMYNCAGHCGNPDRCGPNGHLDQNCECICHDGSSDCDTTKRNTNANCRNEYNSWSCYIWANQGECERNKAYMSRQCAKACGVCGQKPQTSGCKDKMKEQRCQTWKKRGDCITNKGWMKEHCQATCELCSGQTKPSERCDNKYDQEDKTKCDAWAKDGECQINPKWMFTNCKRSCQFCDKDDWDGTNTGGGVDEDKTTCNNTHKDCEMWARKGECTNNPDWMVPFCRKACGKCDDGTCKNLYGDVQCDIWEQKQECVKNSRWMANHCAKSCGRGVCETGGTGSSTARPTGRTEWTTRPTRRTTTQGSCTNRHRSDTECEIWAKNDHCNINPSWMNKYCSRSCNKCTGGGVTSGGGGGTKRTTTIQPNTGGYDVCSDKDRGCPGWAKDGFCDSNPRYNLIFCRKSCNNCNGCRDAEFLCSVWEKAGHCIKNPRYMLRHCQKSCKVCQQKPSDFAELVPEGSAPHLMTSSLAFFFNIAFVTLYNLYNSCAGT